MKRALGSVGVLAVAFPSLVHAMPQISGIEAVAFPNHIVVSANFEDPAGKYQPTTPGAWAFQLLLDTNQDFSRTNYTYGIFEYTVRGTEVEPDGEIHVRYSSGGEGPGGSGASLGLIGLELQGKQLRLDIPLDFLGADDGLVDYYMEFYNVIACANCEGGYTYELDRYFEGSSYAIPEPTTLALTMVGWFALSRCRRRHTSRSAQP